jgi:hypothetical protein
VNVEKLWQVDRGNPKDSGENLSQCCVFIKDPTLTDLGTNRSLHGKKPACNRLNYDMTRVNRKCLAAAMTVIFMLLGISEYYKGKEITSL